MKLEELIPYVPFVGTPYAVHQELQKQGQMSASEVVGTGIGIGLSSFVGFVVAYEVLGDRVLTPTQVKIMREVWTKGPAVAAATSVVAGVTAASIVYEKTVTSQIRKGRPGIYYGPYASGFGRVV